MHPYTERDSIPEPANVGADVESVPRRRADKDLKSSLGLIPGVQLERQRKVIKGILSDFVLRPGHD
jgi:hypothetical protein